MNTDHIIIDHDGVFICATYTHIGQVIVGVAIRIF